MLEILEAPLVAHLGHWIEWVLYAVPVVAVLIAIVVSAYRGRDAGGGNGVDGP